ERVADIDTFQELRRLLDEADQAVADDVRESPRPSGAERQHLKAMRQKAVVAVRATVLDVVVDRVVVAGDRLEGQEVRLRDGAARAAEPLADFEIGKAPVLAHSMRLRIEHAPLPFGHFILRGRTMGVASAPCAMRSWRPPHASRTAALRRCAV